jgi:2-phosphosulfolactate phosphatase
MDWGLDGSAAVGGVDVAVVVDVLSFSTCVCVAADAGIVVLPYRSADDGAAAYAAECDATLAVGRSDATLAVGRSDATLAVGRSYATLAVGRSGAESGQISLSPATIRAARGVARLVLPSPNGSTIAAHLNGHGASVVAGCLRNADAVARWLTDRLGADGGTVGVVAAGERWPGGRLRPAVEDHWGAGAVVSALQRAGWTRSSPEATTAAAAFGAVREDLPARLGECASGAELIAMGFPDDVAIAAELDTSRAVPLLGETGFRDAAGQRARSSRTARPPLARSWLARPPLSRF